MRVGVFGATGQVGGVMRTLLAERGFPVTELRFFASARSAGSTLPWRDGEITVEDTDDGRLQRARPGPVLQRQDRIAGHRAARSPPPVPIVIDNSSAWRMDPDVPLVVSEVNPEDAIRAAQGHHRQPELHHDGRDAGAARRCIGPPACVRLEVATYQAVSGSGGAGVAELDGQVRAVADRAAGLAFDGRRRGVPGARAST